MTLYGPVTHPWCACHEGSSRHAPPKIIWGLAAEPPNLRGVYRPGSLTSHNPKSVWTLPPYWDLANWSSTPYEGSSARPIPSTDVNFGFDCPSLTN